MPEDSLEFLNGKTECSLELFRFFINELNGIEPVKIEQLKSMLAITGRNKFAYVTQIGKNFLHIVIPFDKPFSDNLCFIKIVQVPGSNQYNHHLRLFYKEDFNDEVRKFMSMAMLKI